MRPDEVGIVDADGDAIAASVDNGMLMIRIVNSDGDYMTVAIEPNQWPEFVNMVDGVL